MCTGEKLLIKRICFSSYVWFLLICRKKRRKCCAGEFTVNRIWSFELLYCDKPGTLSSNSVSRSINFPHSSSIRAKKYCNFRGLRCYSGLHKTLEPRPLDPKFNTLLNTDLRVSDNLRTATVFPFDLWPKHEARWP